MPVISTWGAASFAGIRAGTTPQPRGGGGGANGDENTHPGPFGTQQGFDNSATDYDLEAGYYKVTAIGSGGGGSDYATGGAGGYAEALIDHTAGGLIQIYVGSGGSYGSGAGAGGGRVYAVFPNGSVGAGGGGGAGGQNASVGAQGTNSATTVSDGASGGVTDAGAGGSSFITTGLPYQVERGTTARFESWHSTFGLGGIIGGNGAKGRVTVSKLS